MLKTKTQNDTKKGLNKLQTGKAISDSTFTQSDKQEL